MYKPRRERLSETEMQLHEMRSQRDELLAALKLVEFGNAVNQHKCVACCGWNVGPNGETPRVHTTNCQVGIAIARAKETP